MFKNHFSSPLTSTLCFSLWHVSSDFYENLVFLICNGFHGFSMDILIPKTTSQKLPFSHDYGKTYKEIENRIMITVMYKTVFPSGPWSSLNLLRILLSWLLLQYVLFCS